MVNQLKGTFVDYSTFGTRIVSGFWLCLHGKLNVYLILYGNSIPKWLLSSESVIIKQELSGCVIYLCNIAGWVPVRVFTTLMCGSAYVPLLRLRDGLTFRPRTRPPLMVAYCGFINVVALYTTFRNILYGTHADIYYLCMFYITTWRPASKSCLLTYFPGRWMAIDFSALVSYK